MSEETTEDMSRKYDTGPTIETILERIEGEVKLTHSEFYELRADFRELRTTLKEHFPAIK